MRNRSEKPYQPKHSKQPRENRGGRLLSVVASLALALALIPAGAFATASAANGDDEEYDELVTITYNLEGLVSSNTDGSVSRYIDAYRTTLSLQDGMYTYLLPSSISVYIDDYLQGYYQLGNGQYTYDSTTGELFVRPEVLSSASTLVITAQAEAMTVSVPTVTAVTGDNETYESGSWSTSGVTYTISGSETTAPRGIYNYQYSTNGTSWINIALDDDGVGTLAYTTNGDYTLQFRACARVSTTGNATTSIYSDATSFTYKNDKETPTISATASDTTSDYLQGDGVTVSAWAGASQAASIEVSKDGGNYEDITSFFYPEVENVRSYSYNGVYFVTESGTYTFRITNGAGVSETTSITYDNIDSADPVVEVDTGDYVSGTSTTEDVTVTLSNATANLGTTAYSYSADGGSTWIDLETVDGKATLTLSNAGTYELLFRAVSESGKESDTVSLEVIIEQVRTWEVPIEIVVEAGGSVAPPAQDFALELLDLNEEAIDLEAIGATVELSSDIVATDGSGRYTATLTFTGTDDAHSALSDGFKLRLVQDEVAGWAYDDAVYEVNCYFDGGDQVEISIADADWNYCSEAAFTCTYTGWTLSFETNGGSSLDSVTAVDGTVVDLAGYVPAKDGYTFAGWYADEALTTQAASVTLTGDTTVYAGWEAVAEDDPIENPTDDEGTDGSDDGGSTDDEGTDGSDGGGSTDDEGTAADNDDVDGNDNGTTASGDSDDGSDNASTLAKTGDSAPAALLVSALLAACLAGVARARRRLG